MDMKAMIKKSGKPQRAIANETGISETTLSQYVSGFRKVGQKNIHALSSALGVTPADLRPDLAEIFAGSKKN